MVLAHRRSSADYVVFCNIFELLDDETAQSAPRMIF